MTLHLTGLGLATPRHQIDQANAARIAGTLYPGTDELRSLIPALYRQTGIQQRGSVVLKQDCLGDENRASSPQSFFRRVDSPEQHGPSTAERMQLYERHAIELAERACSSALQQAGASSKSITHLVTVSCSGFSSPGVDVQLVQRLALPAGTQRSHVGFMGCHGAFNGLRIAHAFLSADPQAVVLLAAVELCSIHHQYTWRRDQLVANALFADGAAALICQSESEEPAPIRLVASGTTIVPHTLDAMGWFIRDHGFEMTLSAEVPAILERNLRPWLCDWLRSHGYEIDQIGAWAIHPGGPRILKACSAALGLDDAALASSQRVLEEYGNMSSPTILFILDALERDYAPLPWVALAFGPGLTIEAALFDG
jgi:predicted naringenin-chalcone synthase